MLNDLHWQCKCGIPLEKATTKGVKKAISPANEWRCLCMSVSQAVCVCVCMCVCVGVCFLSPFTCVCECVGLWVFVCPRESLPGLEHELKSKQKCFHVWSCQQIYPYCPLRPPLPNTSSFGLCLCAEAFCLISYKQLKLNESYKTQETE